MLIDRTDNRPSGSQKARVGLSPLALLVLAACGGSGSSIPLSPFFTRDGSVVKGPLKDAIVFLDYNGDQLLDPDEPYGRTNTDGTFSLTGNRENSTAKIVVLTDTATIDTSSGSVLADITLTAPSNAAVVSMASTIMVQSNLTENQVQEALGLDAKVDLLSYNPFDTRANATEAEKQLARDVEVKSQMVSSVLTSMTVAAQASGLNTEDAFRIALEAISSLVTETVEKRSQDDLTSEVNFTEFDQLTNVADKVIEAISSKKIENRQVVIDEGLDPNVIDNYASAGVTFVSLIGVEGVKDDIVTAIKNVNEAIDTVKIDDFTQSETVYSVSQALVSQVEAAVKAESVLPGSGTDALTFKNVETVTISKFNPAPTDIDLKIYGEIFDNEDQNPKEIEFSEGNVSPKIAEIQVTDQKADPLGGLITETDLTISLAGEDSTFFNLEDGVLYFRSQPDYEKKPQFEVTILVKDSGEKSYSEKFSINILDVDEPIYNVAVTNETIIENISGGTVGNLSAIDPENRDISFELVGVDDFEQFEITPSGVLKLKDSIAADFETKSSYQITVRASDGINTTDKSIQLNVEDVNEAPALTKPADLNVVEDSGLVVSEILQVSDSEGSEGLTFIVVGSIENGSNLEVAGKYGTLTIDKDTGAYSYLLDDANVEVNALTTDEYLTEEFEISVSDGSLSSDVHELIVTISGVNDAPVIETGIAKIIENEAGYPINTFLAVDPEREKLTYSIVSTSDSDKFRFAESGILKLKDDVSADFETQSSYTLTVRVSDGEKTTEKTFTVSVEDKNEFPALENPILENIIEDSSRDISGRLKANDPDGAEEFRFLVDGATELADVMVVVGSYGTLRLDTKTGVYAYELDNANDLVNALAVGENLTESFSVSVSDGMLVSANKNLSFQILGQDDAPSISVVLSLFKENQLGARTAEISVKDPEGTSFDYFILPESDFEQFEITPSGVLKLKDSIAADFETKSSYQITVRASDGINTTDKSIQLNVEDVNEAPALTKPADLNVVEDSGLVVSEILQVSDSEGSEGLTFIVVGSIENGSNLEVAGKYGTLTIDKDTGAYSYLLDDANVEVNALTTDEYLTEEFEISVSDGSLSSDVHELIVTISGVNDVISNMSLANSNILEYELGALVGQIMVNDPENANLVYTLAEGGDNDLFETTSAGILKLKDNVAAEFNDKPSYLVTLVVSDGVDEVSEDFEISVLDVNLAPIVAISAPDQNVDEDNLFTLTLPDNMFTDGDGETLTILASLVDGTALPNWLNFDADTGVFSGTPSNADVGILNISLSVEDRQQLVAEDSFKLTVTNTNDAPTFQSDPILSILEDRIYSYTVEFDDVDVGDNVFLSLETQPSWLSFDTSSNLLSGIPTNRAVGDHKVVLKATDISGAETKQEFSISVINVNDLPKLNQSIPDQVFQEGDYGSFTFGEDIFSDVDIGDTFTYSAALASGADLPSWINFNSQTRTFQGTPGESDVGSLDVVLSAKDTGNEAASDQFSIVISYLNDAPIALDSTENYQLPSIDEAFVLQTGQNLFIDPDTKHGDILVYNARLSDGSILPDWLSIDESTGTLSGVSPRIEVKENPSTLKLSAYDHQTGEYDANGSLQYQTTYVSVMASDISELSETIVIELSPQAPMKLYETTASIRDYPYNDDPTDTALVAEIAYREGVGNVLTLDSFYLDNSNIKLVSDLHEGNWNLSTWPNSPEIKLNLSETVEDLKNFDLGKISILLAEIKNKNGANSSTIESDEKYLKMQFAVDVTVRDNGTLDFNYDSLIEMDLKFNESQAPLIASSNSTENDTLTFSLGSNGAPDQLNIKFLDLLGQLPFASDLASRFPFETGEYYLSIDGIPLQSSDDTFVDIIETHFTIV